MNLGRIGSIFVLLWCFSSYAAYEMSIRLRTMEGAILEQAAVGRPFLLEVQVHGASSTLGQPIIKGLDGARVHRSGFQMQTMQGSTSVTYNYQVRFDKPGTYTIGPAILDNSQSASVTITVADYEKGKGSTKKIGQDERAFLRLSADQRTVVVGQRIRGSLRFYSSYPAEISRVIEPDAQECAAVSFGKKSGPNMGTEMINNQEYKYAEWQFDMYPQKEGPCVLPAFAAEYTAYDKRAHLFNPFAALIPAMAEQKKIYSNAITIHVEALPDSARGVQAIGHFTLFQATLDKHAAQVGDGLLLKLTLQGDGDWEKIKIVPLHVSDSITWYESKINVEHGTKNEKKIFEYILQPRTPGTFTIPEQSFTFYDVEEQRVKHLKTEPLTISVSANGHRSSAPIEQKPEKNNQEVVSSSSPESIAVPAVLLEYNASQRWPAIGFPWFIFALFFVLSAVLMQAGARYWAKKNTGVGLNGLFAQARKQIIAAQQKHNSAILHDIFVRFFAAYSNVVPASMTQEHIEHLLRQRHVPAATIEHWSLFFSRLAESVYYHTNTEEELLFSKALQWIDTFKELL